MIYSVSKNIVTQGHRRWYHSIRRPWLRINVP